MYVFGNQVIRDVSMLLAATTANMCEVCIPCILCLICYSLCLWYQESVEKLVAIVPLLNQYIALHKVLVVNLSHAHRTCCKLTSILLALFSDLVSKVPKSTCIPY